MGKKSKKAKITKGDKQILASLTDEQKRSYLVKSRIIFLLNFVSISTIGLFFIPMVLFNYTIGGGEALLILPYAIIELVRFFKKSREEKILDYYTLVNAAGGIDSVGKGFIWLAEVCIILLTVVAPLCNITKVEIGASIFLIMVALSGLYLAGLIWFAALRKGKNKNNKQSDTTSDQEANKDEENK